MNPFSSKNLSMITYMSMSVFVTQISWIRLPTRLCHDLSLTISSDKQPSVRGAVLGWHHKTGHNGNYPFSHDLSQPHKTTSSITIKTQTHRSPPNALPDQVTSFFYGSWLCHIRLSRSEFLCRDREFMLHATSLHSLSSQATYSRPHSTRYLTKIYATPCA
jgi:hypothetical protein